MFISYTIKDQELIKPLITCLEDKNFEIWTHEDFKANTSWYGQMKNTIKFGYSVVLLTEEYINSKFCIIEFKEILKNSEKALILAIGNIKLPKEFLKLTCYHIPKIKTKEDLKLIAELIEADLKIKIKGPMSQGDAHQKYSDIQEKLNYEKRYHPCEPELVAKLGASEDYCEVYRFPCCGATVQVADGPISRFRADGCCKPKKKKKL